MITKASTKAQTVHTDRMIPHSSSRNYSQMYLRLYM